jgi:hypothetical protein
MTERTLPTFQHGKDYEITWQIPGVHRIPRMSRVGFIGASGSRLSFDARGPDRSNKAPYGGTTELDRRWIKEVKEVTRDLTKRYPVKT